MAATSFVMPGSAPDGAMPASSSSPPRRARAARSTSLSRPSAFAVAPAVLSRANSSARVTPPAGTPAIFAARTTATPAAFFGPKSYFPKIQCPETSPRRLHRGLYCWGKARSSSPPFRRSRSAAAAARTPCSRYRLPSSDRRSLLGDHVVDAVLGAHHEGDLHGST